MQSLYEFTVVRRGTVCIAGYLGATLSIYRVTMDSQGNKVYTEYSERGEDLTLSTGQTCATINHKGDYAVVGSCPASTKFDFTECMHRPKPCNDSRAYYKPDPTTFEPASSDPAETRKKWCPDVQAFNMLSVEKPCPGAVEVVTVDGANMLPNGAGIWTLDPFCAPQEMVCFIGAADVLAKLTVNANLVPTPCASGAPMPPPPAPAP